jgi:hypothetical protein
MILAPSAPDRKTLRKFGLLMAGVCIFVFGTALPWVKGRHIPWWPWPVGAFFLVGVGLPKLLDFPYRTWMALGHILGWVNSRIILGIVYYLLVWPVGLMMRLAGKDPLRRRLDRASTSYRITYVSTPETVKQKMERPY